MDTLHVAFLQQNFTGLVTEGLHLSLRKEIRVKKINLQQPKERNTVCNIGWW